MIVIDTNVLVYYMIESGNEAFHGQARQLAEKRGAEWRLPPLWRHEFLNALSSHLRAGRMKETEAADILEKSGRYFGKLERENGVNHFSALELSKKYSVSGYDAQFLAMAAKLDTRVVTEDKKLRAAAPHLTMSMAEANSA